MAVSSIKCCWYKFSARIRDYLDVVDSYYRPADETNHYLNHQRACDRIGATKDKQHNCHHKSSRNRHCTDQNKFQSISVSSKLPPGYSKRKTSQGQVYFVDPNGQRYWFDPGVPKELLTASLNLDLLVGRLSSTWEIRQTTSGKTYYVNHIKKTTQFTDPRLVAYKDQLMHILKTAKSENRATTTTGSSSNADTGVSSLSPVSNDSQPQNSNRNTSRNLGPSPYHNNNQRVGSNVTSTNSSLTHSLSRPSNPSNRRRHGTNSIESRPNQYRANLLSGSHHDLTTTSSHRSNTLTVPPGWMKRNIPNVLKQNTSNSQNNHGSSNNRSTNSHAANRTGSISNLYTISANMPTFDTAQQPNVRSNKELSDKISILRQELLKQQVIAHPCRIDISRKRIFEESFRVVTQMQPRDLKKRLLVKFRGEEGLDYGGVAREWFYLLSREILNPVHGLFQYTSDDIYNLQINPDSGIVYREHLSYMNFCGRVIGMAVFHGHFIEGHFTLPFYKMLLRRPISLADIEFVDPDLYRSLCWILENDITNVIDTTFLVQHNAFGQLQEHELKENGRNIAVTETNKHEYVTLYVNYRCRRGIESQFEALQRGFYELISPSLIDNFDEYELELLIGGLSTIDIEDWRLHTKLKNCTVDSPLVRWFWDIVASYGEDRRARLLQFVTGSPRVPIQGFKALQGVNSELRLFTIHLIKNAATDNLPKSHTCFNRIDLPPYETYEKLHDKLTQAIEETIGFAIQ